MDTAILDHSNVCEQPSGYVDNDDDCDDSDSSTIVGATGTRMWMVMDTAMQMVARLLFRPGFGIFRRQQRL